MSDLARKFTEEALLLPREDRAELVEQLLESLNAPTQREVDRLWAEEAEKRVIQYDEGKIELLNGDQVFKEIRTRFKR